jgi:hypothetical protein
MGRAKGLKFASFCPYTASFHSISPTYHLPPHPLPLSFFLSFFHSFFLSFFLSPLTSPFSFLYFLSLLLFPIPLSLFFLSFLSKGTLWNLNPAELVGAWELVDVAGQVELGPYIRTLFYFSFFNLFTFLDPEPSIPALDLIVLRLISIRLLSIFFYSLEIVLTAATTFLKTSL